MTPGTVVSEAEAQVEYDENGEPIPSTQDVQPQQKTENDPVVKKALEILK
ncbi:MAG TPA: hypothetical protein VGF59_05515 [Bryobacteraceae bacterium]